MVLIATVVPCRNNRASSNRVPAFSTPLSMPVTSRAGVVRVLPSVSSPVASSNAATSVNVPPTSAERRILEAAELTDAELPGRAVVAAPSRIHQGFGRHIRDEGMRRRMRDKQRQPRVFGGALRGDAA